MMNPREQDYFDWLRKMVNLDEPANDIMAYTLYNTAFGSVIDGDENRAEDGIELRDKYVDETHNYDLQVSHMECNMLEFIIALAARLDYVTYNHKLGVQIAKWAHVYLDNLRVLYNQDADNISYRIVVLLSGSYDDYGNNGIFSFSKPIKNLSAKPYWDQMNLFVSENFDKLY